MITTYALIQLSLHQGRPRPPGAPEPVPRPGPGLRRPGPHAKPAVRLRALRGDERADLQAFGRLGVRGGLPRGLGQAGPSERPLPSPSPPTIVGIEVTGAVAPSKVNVMNLYYNYFSTYMSDTVYKGFI